MIKTIKVKKQLRLDELIKYVWDNHLYPETFKSNFNDFAHFDKTGKYQLIDQRGINQATKFTVEVEEPITEDTVFKCLLEIIDGELVYIRNKKTIKESVKDDTDRFYALIDGKLELVYEREDKNV